MCVCACVSVSVCVCACVSVCVEHLNRCKISTVYLICREAVTTKRLLQVTDMDSGRRIHIPASPI